VIQCEVTKDIPADDELVAMLTVSEAAPVCPSVVADADACPAAPAAAELPSLSPVVMRRSPVLRSGDGGGEAVEGRKTGDASTKPVIGASADNTNCRPCPALLPSHHNVVSNSKKKDRAVNHPNLATSTTCLSDIEQQRRSFCK